MARAGTSGKAATAFRTIGEAAEVIGVPQHVLRFWETRFSALQPLKRGGGRRYYRPEDMALLESIRSLLHDQGMTIRGAQQLLEGLKPGAATPTVAATAESSGAGPTEGVVISGPEAAAHTGLNPTTRAVLLGIRARLADALAA